MCQGDDLYQVPQPSTFHKSPVISGKQSANEPKQLLNDAFYQLLKKLKKTLL